MARPSMPDPEYVPPTITVDALRVQLQQRAQTEYGVTLEVFLVNEGNGDYEDDVLAEALAAEATLLDDARWVRGETA